MNCLNVQNSTTSTEKSWRSVVSNTSAKNSHTIQLAAIRTDASSLRLWFLPALKFHFTISYVKRMEKTHSIHRIVSLMFAKGEQPWPDPHQLALYITRDRSYRKDKQTFHITGLEVCFVSPHSITPFELTRVRVCR